MCIRDSFEESDALRRIERGLSELFKETALNLLRNAELDGERAKDASRDVYKRQERI